MISPVSFYSPAFRGVTIKDDNKTKAAFKQLPNGVKQKAEKEFENLRASLDKKAGDDVDLEVSCEYFHYNCLHPDMLAIDIHNPKPESCNISFSRTLCAIHKDEFSTSTALQREIEDGMLSAKKTGISIIDKIRASRKDNLGL